MNGSSAHNRLLFGDVLMSDIVERALLQDAAYLRGASRPNDLALAGRLERAADRVVRLKAALPPANALRALAAWFDADDVRKGGERGSTVQRDLREWADAIDAVSQ